MKNRLCSIPADEATDCAMNDQMAPNLRSIGNDIIRKKFVSFFKCENRMTGAGLYLTINL